MKKDIMKDLKEVGLGLLGLGHLVWERFGDWWRVASMRQRLLALAVIGVPLLLTTCVALADAADANYAEVQIVGTPKLLMCYQENGVPETGAVRLCLQSTAVPMLSERHRLFNGMAEYCAIVGYNEQQGLPVWDCANTYEEMQMKKVGI